MFIRIVQDGRSSLYECEHVHTTTQGSSDGENLLVLFIEGERGQITVSIDKNSKEDVGVYAMNNEGRTIDTIFKSESRSQYAIGGPRG